MWIQEMLKITLKNYVRIGIRLKQFEIGIHVIFQTIDVAHRWIQSEKSNGAESGVKEANQQQQEQHDEPQKVSRYYDYNSAKTELPLAI